MRLVGLVLPDEEKKPEQKPKSAPVEKSNDKGKSETTSDKNKKSKVDL